MKLSKVLEHFPDAELLGNRTQIRLNDKTCIIYNPMEDKAFKLLINTTKQIIQENCDSL